MRSFAEILDIAIERHGSFSAVEARLPIPLSRDALRAVPDDRWLSMMAKDIFRAGFNWSVIDTKWDAFETAFAGFAPNRLVGISEGETDALHSDHTIVRNGAKIAATLENA